MIDLCPNLLSEGSCHVEDCPYVHNVFHCKTCNVLCPSAYSLQSHINGKKHRKVARGIVVPVRCTICDVLLSSNAGWFGHADGRRHNELAEVFDLDPQDTSNMEEQSGNITCDICHKVIQRSSWAMHLNSLNHKKREEVMSFKSALEEAGRDRHGVTISHGDDGIDFGVIDFVDNPSWNPTSSINVTVNLTSHANVILNKLRISSMVGRQSSDTIRHFAGRGRAVPQLLERGKPYTVEVQFSPYGLRGQFEDRLEFVFNDVALRQQFTIIRPLRAVVGVQADLEALKPVAPYVRAKRRVREPEGEIVRGVPPPALAAIEWKVALGKFQLPPSISAALQYGSQEDQIQRVKRTILPQVLNTETYGRHWHTLLYIEEDRLRTNLQAYDVQGETLTREYPYYFLDVPGLAEKRPSVIVGDTIKVQNVPQRTDHWFEGFVHKVQDKRVGLKFAPSFSSYAGQRYNVRFSLSRLPLRRMHQGLDTAFYPPRVLFPTPRHQLVRSPPARNLVQAIRPTNRSIAENPPQLLAVASILHLPKGSPPFIVFGPPGTGKTVTIIEAIRQLLAYDSDACILACAPSNSAADLIAERLRDLPNARSSLFRMNAPSRAKNLLPPTLLPFSRLNEDGVFCVSEVNILSKFRVVVSTCISASVPHSVGMKRGHFTHIFIDEAGQACEPEAMIAIKTMADSDTNIIISGDPKQLGPIVHSPIADNLGLGLSYLDRLMQLEMYEPHKGHGITVVKLIKNWRSHPSILHFPNKTFYESELQACASPVVIDSLLQWEKLPRKGFPIVFHAISGKDMREGSSPSYFNGDEASVVKTYVEALRSNQKLRLKDEQIGVISPYNAQCAKIRKLLERSYKGIKVGSTEEFQGQERRVIIVSTVRSSKEQVAYDIKHTLGFVANPRRFNVAMTRAQALLIIIGEPAVLSLEPLWRAFLNYIHRSGGWTGKRIDWDDDDDEAINFLEQRQSKAKNQMDDLVSRLQDLVLEDRESDSEDGDDVHDRPWREDE